MIFTCQIQKVEFFADQFEDKGSVTLDEAIDLFQNFPFEEQFIAVKEQVVNTGIPTIRFKSTHGKELWIQAEDEQGFEIEYYNGKQVCVFFISNEFGKNPDEWAVEDCIAHFFNDTIEHHIELTDTNTYYSKSENEGRTAEGSVTFSFRDTNKIKSSLWLIPYLLLSFAILIIVQSPSFDGPLPIKIAGSLFWLPWLWVPVSYWLKNYNAQVTVNLKEKTIEYKKDGNSIKFNRDDIHYCELNHQKKDTLPHTGYRYLWIVLKDRRYVIITNFITEPEKIGYLLHLKVKTNDRFIPFLPVW